MGQLSGFQSSVFFLNCQVQHNLHRFQQKKKLAIKMLFLAEVYKVLYVISWKKFLSFFSESNF